MASKILIVDDEKDIVNMLSSYFRRSGYEVLTASCGQEAIQQVNNQPDLILLDINMPDMDGLEVCSRIRAHITCPILFLTARIEDNDKIQGFAVGGDEYVVKPFSIDVLGAQVAAHLRRDTRYKAAPSVRFDSDLVLDYSQRAVFIKDKEINFAKKEFDIIEFLSKNAGIVFDKERIYERVWGYDSEGDSSVVTEHIRRIRGKFAAAGANPYIEAVWGCGYKWAK